MGTEESRPIGQRVKAARGQAGISVQDLAEKAGCSAEYLEWIEEDQVEAPVALLLRLARAMKLDSGAFLLADEGRDQRLSEQSKRTEHYSYQTLTPSQADKHLMAFSVNIPPRTAHEGVGYRHEGEEFVYVLSGQVELTIDQKKRTLETRQSLRFNSALDHHLSNPGEKEAELLVILYVP